MSVSVPRTADIFPIAAETWRASFSTAGQLDAETLPFAEWLHFRNVPGDGPLHYLWQLPFRPTLSGSERRVDREAYEAGLWLGSVVVRKIVSLGQVDTERLVMPYEPDVHEQIGLLRRQAVGHRFRLQQFFESRDDMLTAMYQLVEYPWYEHNVRFGVNKGLGEDGKPHDDYVVVGAGDMLGLSYTLLLDHPPMQIVPLVGVDAGVSLDTMFRG